MRRKALGTNWARGVFSGTPATVLPGAKVLIGSVTLSNPGIGEVVRRTRGRISVSSDQSAVMEQQTWALGFIVVTDVALAVGVASLPGPVTQANDDGWFVWESGVQISGWTAGGNVTHSILAPYDFDSKAMRKVEEGYAVAVVAENGGPDGMEIQINFSLLSSRIGQPILDDSRLKLI